MMKRIKKHTSCVLCGSPFLEYEFKVEDYNLQSCRNCKFMFLNPPPDENTLKEYIAASADDEGEQNTKLKMESAKKYLENIKRYGGDIGNKLLEIDPDDWLFMQAALHDGFEVTGVQTDAKIASNINKTLGRDYVVNGDLITADLPEKSFDICVIKDTLNYYYNPLEVLDKIHTLLKPGGILFLTTPSLDSWSARTLKHRWMKFSRSRLHYFDSQTIQLALTKAGFQNIYVNSDQKYVSLDYLRDRMKHRKLPFYARLVPLFNMVSPKKVRRMLIYISTSGISVLSRATEKRKRPLVSVIMPVFNEQRTFTILMNELLPKKIPGMDKEIIIVESNSTDGTREDAQKFSEHPEVKLVLEDRPRGKGHAVRTGFEYASGDYILIQDGDLEYDLNDYEILLEPIVRGEAAFVLGSRHSKGWKIRQFRGANGTAFIMNLAGKFFVGLINVFYRQSMTDPFTMYKVFRRDCLYGLKFECNRFDFDHELVIKLVRKGYVPHEVTVNYKSRPFSEGKKIRLWRDPVTWIKAIFKFRFVKIYFPYPDQNKKNQ